MLDSRYKELRRRWGARTPSKVTNRQWKRIAQILQCTADEAKEFGQRLLSETTKKSEDISEAAKDVELPKDDQYTHTNTYWYDPQRGVYVIWLPHLPKPLALPEHMWSEIKAAYSQWQGSPASVEEIARRHGLTRRTVTALLRTMSHTHTGSPWTREYVAQTPDEALVEDLILAREERVLRKAEAHHWDKVKAKAEAWERLQRGHLDALNDWLSKPQQVRVTRVPKMTKTTQNPKYLLVLGITDLHYGALDHDAGEALDRALEKMYQRLEMRGTPDKIVLPIGSDGLHYDTAGYTTTSGTRMEAAGPAREVLVGYMDLMAEVIEDLSAIAPVYCIPVAGNHDRMMSYATYAAMRLAFRENDRVEFSESLNEIQVITYGRTFVGVHHGDRHKPDALAGILPRDFRKQWGGTTYHYCLLGHYHTPGTFGTKSGLECIYMPSLAPTDEWTEGQGYRSHPSLSAYIFDPGEGLVAVDTVRGVTPDLLG